MGWIHDFLNWKGGYIENITHEKLVELINRLKLLANFIGPLHEIDDILDRKKRGNITEEDNEKLIIILDHVYRQLFEGLEVEKDIMEAVKKGISDEEKAVKLIHKIINSAANSESHGPLLRLIELGERVASESPIDKRHILRYTLSIAEEAVKDSKMDFLDSKDIVLSTMEIFFRTYGYPTLFGVRGHPENKAWHKNSTINPFGGIKVQKWPPEEIFNTIMASPEFTDEVKKSVQYVHNMNQLREIGMQFAGTVIHLSISTEQKSRLLNMLLR